MKNFLKEKLSGMVKDISNKPISHKSLILIIALITAISIPTIVIKTVHRENYKVLYSHLSPDDAGNILTVLQESKIPYRIHGDGSIILVPENLVYDTRLKLASKGLPKGKTVGLEIFEEPKFGITKFQENIEYQRALQGELERTIKRLDAVKGVKVNLAIPEESIFLREEDTAKASVILELWPGKNLTREQVKAIIFLVSHAVPKLKPENVAVVDNSGRVLNYMLETEEEMYGEKEIAVKRNLEKQIERKVQSMLAKALGSEKIAVKATIEIETGKLEQKQEIYDPDRTATISERKIQKKEKSTFAKPQGIPGSSTNIPPVLPQGEENVFTSKESKDITTNYNVSKTVEKKISPIFKIKRISVGVLIDSKYEKITDKNGKVTYRAIPRTPEEIEMYENLVKSAIGYDKERGDKVTVVSVPFETHKAVTYKEKEEAKIPAYASIIAIASTIIAVLTILAIKTFKKKRKPESIPEVISQIQTKSREEIEDMNIESEPAYVKVSEIADKQPEVIASIIGKWLKEEGIKK